MKILRDDGSESQVVFLREDGTEATNTVYAGAEGPDGALIFFELMGLARPRLAGREKYLRLMIRRVVPALPEPPEPPGGEWRRERR